MVPPNRGVSGERSPLHAGLDSDVTLRLRRSFTSTPLRLRASRQRQTAPRLRTARSVRNSDAMARGTGSPLWEAGTGRRMGPTAGSTRSPRRHGGRAFTTLWHRQAEVVRLQSVFENADEFPSAQHGEA